MPTNVICTDGTVIECETFEAVDSGVLLYFADDDVDPEDDREAELTASGFVPVQAIRYVLPADVPIGPTGTGHRAGAPTTPPPQQQTGYGMPPGGQGPPAGGPEPRGRPSRQR